MMITGPPGRTKAKRAAAVVLRLPRQINLIKPLEIFGSRNRNLTMAIFLQSAVQPTLAK